MVHPTTDLVSIRKAIQTLEGLPFKQRRSHLLANPVLPYPGPGLRPKFSNAENLRLILAAASPARIRLYETAGRLSWTPILVRRVLDWGVRSGYLAHLSNHLYRLVRLPPLDAADPTVPDATPVVPPATLAT